MSPRSNRVLAGIVFAVLWTAGMLFRSPTIDTRAIVVAGITGVITGLLMYWLFDKLSGTFRS
jgi:Co/Zn/Cd efflux system component